MSNLKGISGLQAFIEQMDTTEATLDLPGAYEQVATIQRVVNLRANGLASLPIGLFRLDSNVEVEGQEYDDVINFLRPLLYQLTANLVIYGSAYMTYYKGFLGGKPATLVRALISPSVAPQYDPYGNLTHFYRYYGNQIATLPLKDILWVWYFNPRYENYPGISPLQTVLRSAGTLHNLNIFAEHFFKNGALMPTIFTLGDGNSSIPSVITDKEMSSFRSRLQRLLVGVKNAWRVDVMRGNIQSHTIGALPRDIAANELTTLTNQEICSAFGIPGAVFRSETANYANAREDEFHFYDKTVVPEATIIIAPKINEWLKLLGYRIEFQPHLLESYQYTQLQQALTIGQLVGTVLSVNEGRELMGYEPVEGGDEVIRQYNMQDNFGNPNEKDLDTTDDDDEDIKRWRMSYEKLWDDYVTHL